MFDRRLLLATSMIAGLGAATFAPSLAFAQDTPPIDDTTAQAAPLDDPAPEATEVEELVITGSRIRRNEYTSPAPIQVITREQNTLEGLADTAELLQTTSSASGSQQINNQLGGFVIEGGGGVNTLSLRGLGAQRSLVLLNGRRAGPAGVGGQVGAFDLNVIPESAVERYEILKDGASSIYGSDAVAGVVNIITRDDVDGGDVEVYYSRPFDSGGEALRVAGTWGKTFDRGTFSVSGDYYKEYELEVGDRSYTRCSNDYYHNLNGDLVDIISRRTGQPFCYQNSANNTVFMREWNFFIQYDPTQANGPYEPFASLFSDLSLAPPNWYLAAVGDSNVGLVDYYYGSGAYDYSTYEYLNVDERIDAGSSVIAPLERMTVFATGSYDVSPTTQFYGELLLNRRNSEQHAVRTIAPEILTGTYGNPIHPAVATSASPYVDNLPFNFEQQVDYTRYVAGLRGDFVNAPFVAGWNWDIFASQSFSRAKYSNDAILDDAMWALGDSEPAIVLEGVEDVNLGGCTSVPVTPISGRTCVPIDWFDPDTLANGLTPEQIAFISYRAEGSTDYTQSVIEGSMSGDLFTLPAGDVGAALGFHWRKDSLDDSPDPFAVNRNLWGQTTAGRTVGSDTVKEVYGEVEVPLLRGMRFAEQVTLSGSARYSDYESYGENSTYKLGLNWQMSSQFRIRGTYGTSFRAPALYEMFLANLTGFLGQNSIDPCIRHEDSDDQILQQNCEEAGIEAGYIGVGSAATIAQGGGGSGFLDPETSLAQSLGFIWTPDFIDLSVAIDYFEIRVEDQVAQFGAANIVNLCYALQDFPNDFCNLFIRDEDPSSPTYHNISFVQNSYVNIAEQHNRGFDLTTRYKHSFPWADMTIDTQFSWQIEDIINFSGIATLDANNVSGEPAFSGGANIRFDRGDWTANWAIDTIGHQFPSEPITGGTSRYPDDVIFKRWRESTTYHAVSLRKKFDDWSITGGVRNVFDEHPPAQSFNEFRLGTAALNQYDLRGRRAFINVSKSF